MSPYAQGYDAARRWWFFREGEEPTCPYVEHTHTPRLLNGGEDGATPVTITTR